MTVKATPLLIRFEVDPDNAIINRFALYSFDSSHTLTYCRFGDEFLINLIDCPGHLEFIAELSAALRMADGALLIIDYTLGFDPRTEIMVMADPRQVTRHQQTRHSIAREGCRKGSHLSVPEEND